MNGTDTYWAHNPGMGILAIFFQDSHSKIPLLDQSLRFAQWKDLFERHEAI